MIPTVDRTKCGVVIVTVVIISVTGIALLAMLKDSGTDVERTEQAARRYLANLEPEILACKTREAELYWAYITKNNGQTLNRQKEGATRNAQFFKEMARELRKYDSNSFKDADLKRRLKKLSNLGYAALDEKKFKMCLDLVTHMKQHFETVKVCEYQNDSNCNISRNPELIQKLANSRDPEELKHYWIQWHDIVGRPVRRDYERYVQLNREAAQLNNYTSGAEYWLSEYEDDSLESQVDFAIDQIKPLYEQLHAYVRYKLRKHYGNKIVSEKGPIPIHLLGHMHAIRWNHIADITAPFSSKALFDVTEEMVRQGYTTKKIFEKADKFFQSINFTKLPPSFWEKSIFEERANSGDQCRTNMWDFYRKDDVRIYKCTHVNMTDLFLVHNELGYIQYYLQYQHQPSVYRDEALPGFYETIGRAILLSISTPKHLEKIGLLKTTFGKWDEDSKLNHLFRLALKRFVILPYAYSLEKYRWEVFRGHIKPENYNCKFWEMRSKHAGVEPPVTRSENDFDAAAMYHVVADLEYLRYYVSHIMQFQFHRAACEKAGQYVKGDPEKTLSNCDISQSTAAGNALKEIMAMGSSKPWPDVMEAFTGQRKMSTDALLEYFQPLYDWLVKENKALGVHVGWDESLKCK